MDAFSYLSVLLSIILGLAITQVLQGLGQLLQARGRVRWYWPSALWMATLLLIYVQSWWAMFGLRNVQSWTFAAFAVVLLQIVLEYLLAALLVPVVADEVDMRAEYYAHSRWFFAAFFLVLAASLAKDVVLGGTLPPGLNLGFHLVQMGIFLAAMATRSEPFHAGVAVFSLAVFVAYIALLFTRLR
jgi:hypothetical protein